MAFEPKLKVQRSEISVTKPIKNALLPRVNIPNIDCFLNGNKTPLPSLHTPQKVPPPLPLRTSHLCMLYLENLRRIFLNDFLFIVNFHKLRLHLFKLISPFYTGWYAVQCMSAHSTINYTQ